MIGPIVTRGFSIGSIALVTLRGYFFSSPPPSSSGGSWLVLWRRRGRR